MAHFTEDVTVVNHLSGRVHQWEMCEPMTYRLVDADDAEFVTVPPAFKTDFASVPRPFWFWLAPWGRHGRAAIVHDFLYQLGAVTNPVAPVATRLRRPPKQEADRIFRQAMGVLDEAILTKSRLWDGKLKPLAGVRLALAVPRRWLMWAAVAAFGHRAYKKEQAKGSAPPLEHRMLASITPSGD
jgi:hypothetical protein